MNPAVRAARAMIEIIGFTPGAVGSRLPSPIQRFRTSCDSPVGFAAEVFGLAPARAEPIGWAENGVALFSAHPMGSARAGANPKTSAAKPTGESHDVRNLWIGDGSLLPTAPGVNPMISIMALAARTAGFIRERLSHVN